MGVYMSYPVKDKVSSSHENKFLKCGASSMQGWRVSQEDAHNCCLDFDKDTALFAVYDGHGGAEVAEYASLHLPNTIRETDAYKAGDLENALKDAFLKFDATLITAPVLEELKKIAAAIEQEKNARSAMSDDTDEDDVQGLREEAIMPLADVIARYANGTLPKTPALKRICGESSKSPFLRARPCSTSDSEVTSSSSSDNADSEDCPEAVTNGVADSNGETCADTSSDAVGESSQKVENCDAVSSSSMVNGESPSKVSSTGRLSAKRAVNIYRSLLAADTDEDSDSDENDESFCAPTDTSTVQSSDDEAENVEETEKNGEESGDNNETEDENDEEDEDEEEDDDDDEEEEEDDVQEGVIETDLSETEEPGNDSGCTAVVSLVTRNRVIVANAGDSRAVLCRKGEAVDLSVDHKPEDPVELKRITAAGGRVTSDGRVNGGLNLSRALGDHMYKKSSKFPATEQMITALPDIKAVDLKEDEDEFIVLACDGIWNSMSSQEVVDFIRPCISNGETLVSICEKLFESCLAKDTRGDGTGCDNMTCVIIQLFPHLKVVGTKRKLDVEVEASSETEETNKRVRVESAEET